NTIVLAQQKARLVVDERCGARAPAGALVAARAELQEPPAEQLGIGGRRRLRRRGERDEARGLIAAGLRRDQASSLKHLMSWESVLTSNIATGEDEHAQPSIAHCRYSERMWHSWQECVERCVEDGMARRMLLVGLPEGERRA
ncbi:unnamed protein product, partial [Prorocentrum cordatum]